MARRKHPKLCEAKRRRDVRDLAARAQCCLEEAERHKLADERYCATHGTWHRQQRCPQCNRDKKAQRRERRRNQRQQWGQQPEITFSLAPTSRSGADS